MAADPHELERLFEKTGVLDFELDARASSADLATLIDAHRGRRHWLPLLQLVAMHPAADDGVLSSIIRDTKDSGVLNSIATSGRASARVLRELTRSRHRSVREHAEMALLNLELAAAAPARFREILESHRGEGEHEAAVRALLAMHPRAPSDVLDELARDEVEFVQRSVPMRPKAP